MRSGKFLGIRIQKHSDNKFLLTQPGLINKVIKTTKMEDCNTVQTPATVDALSSDKD